MLLMELLPRFVLKKVNLQSIILINNSRNAWPSKIVKLFVRFYNNVLQKAYMIFKKQC